MLHTFPSESEFNQTVVTEITSRIVHGTQRGKVFRLALSGGSTPGPVYKQLAEQKGIDWSQVELYLVDERYVPLDHLHSNYRMIRETLLNQLPVQPKKVVFFDTSLSIEQSLKKYESQLDPTQKEFFDLVLLGIGPDGHTASLFPNSLALNIRSRWVAHTTTDQFDVHDRLTLTFPALESSKEIFFLVKGREKEEILKLMNNSETTALKFPSYKLFNVVSASCFYFAISAG